MKYTRIAPLALAMLPFICTVAGAQTPGRYEQGTLIYDGIPVEEVAAASSLTRWLDARSASFVDWLADGTLVVATRFGNTAQLHRLRAPLAMREQFTFDAEPVSNAVSHPWDASLLLYRKDKGGDENQQIWLRNLADGSDRLLTDGRSRHGAPVFAHDARRIAFSGNAHDPASNDIFISDITLEAEPQLVVTGGSDSLSVEDWSLEDRQIAVIRYTSITDSALLLVDVATGARTTVVPAPGVAGPVSVAQARFARDGRGLFFLSDRGGEFIGLHYYDLYTREIRTLTPNPVWDVERFDLTGDGRFIAYTINEAGIDRLVLHDLSLQADVILPALPPGAVIGRIGFDRNGRQLAVSLESAQSPMDVYVYQLDTSADASAVPQVQLARWTKSELGPIDAAKLVPAELVQYPTWDSPLGRPRMLPAFVFRPRTPGPHPVLIDIHGGPESQYRPEWDPFTQYLVNELGFVVVAPNVRGSSGYGRSFLKLDNGMLREDSVRDIGALLVWIGLQPDMDRSRVVVSGGSYGGYMSLASLVHYGDRLAGGIDVVGISNFVTFLTNTSAYRRDLRRVEYGDEREPAMRAHLQNISPLNNAAAIRKPLLIVQGLNDPRVPASESEQMMATVRSRGGDVWYLAATDEGHGFRKKANRDVYLATMAVFLKRLAARPAPAN